MKFFNFCFWLSDCEEILPFDYYGDISGATSYAQELANVYNQIINVIDIDFDDVVSTVYPDNDIYVDIDSIDVNHIINCISVDIKNGNPKTDRGER